MQRSNELLGFFLKRAGFSQKQAALYIGISPSELNELLRGKRKLTPGYFAAIRVAGILEQDELFQLQRQILVEYSEELGADLSLYENDPLSGIEARIEIIHRLHLKGDPTAPIALLPSDLELCKGLRDLYPSEKERIERWMAFSLIDLIDAYSETSSAKTITKDTSKYLKLLDSVRNSLKWNDEDREQYELVDVLYPSVLHVAKQTEISARIARVRQPSIKTSLPTAFFVRIMAMGNALKFEKLDAADRTQDATDKILAVYEQDKEVLASSKSFIRSGDLAQVYESFSRTALTLGKLDDAGLFLDEAKASYTKSIVDSSYRTAVGAAIARTDFNLIHHTDDVLVIVTKAAEALGVFGIQYSRHKHEVIDKLKGHPHLFIQQFGQSLDKKPDDAEG